MKSPGIRGRILLATLAPTTLVAGLISVLLVTEQLKHAREDQHARLSAVAQQLSTAARYSLFVGNNEGLLKLLESARANPDVRAAAFLDNHGKVLAISPATETITDTQQRFSGFAVPPETESIEHWHSQAIAAESADGFDLFVGADAPAPPKLGQLLLKISNASLHDDMRRYIMTAALISSAMLLFGILLALALSRRLIRGLADIGQVVEGIGQGHNALRVANPGGDELGQLALDINEMAQTVKQTQDLLAARVEAATASLRRERDEAEEASQARSRFFAAASHDLRQPVQALGLFIARLEQDAQNSPLHARVIQVRETVRNLQTLLDTLLDFSRLDGQVFPIKLGPVQATLAIQGLINGFSGAAAAKHIVLRARIADCWLMTDAALLYRILSNLIANAIRHSHSGSILVACRRGTNHARIEVWDTGPGIPAEFHQTIFEEFVQLDNPERDFDKGLGLGLAIVRRTAGLLNHPLSLCSRVGHGSRFSIQVPLTTPSVPVETGNDLLGETPPTRILIVGMPTPEGHELSSILEHWGFTVEQIDSAATLRTHIFCISHITPIVLLWSAPEGAVGVRQAEDHIDSLESDTGRQLPVLIISNGPLPALASQKGPRRLLLARPFRPARLRALLNRLTAC